MDYIFKNDFLDIGSKNKNTNFQYYQWAQKKRLQKEKAQYQQFKKLWFDANQEDQQKQEIQLKKAKSIDKKLTVVKPEQLYRKNMEWKQGVDEKLSKIREEKKEKEEKQLENLFLSRQKEPKILRDSQHKGPIKAWKERFDGYLKSKCGEEIRQLQQYDFRPTIDRNSRRIMKQSTGHVQDRLIEYGERLKVKKAQMETIFQQQLHAQRNSNHQNSAVSQSSDVYWRLYKDGQRLNKKRNQQKSQYSFTPSINSNSASIASKIQQKRIPLYHSKVLNSKAEQTNRMQETNKRGTQKSFNDFLRRNQALLLKIQKNKLRKMQVVKQKQNSQIRQCTFTPVLNPKSLRMFADAFSRRNINQTDDKIENLSQIQAMTPFQQQSLEKKVIGAKSDVNDVNNSDKLAKSTQRIQRLHSDGNLNKQNHNNPSYLYIKQEDSISNINNTQQTVQNQINQSSQLFMKRQIQKLQSNDSDFFTSSKKNERENFQHIYEEPQEDSIQRQKDSEWQKQLNMMEKQIQAMMQRATL